METIAEDGGSRRKKEVWCQRENEAEGLRIRQQHKGDIYTQRKGGQKVLWLRFRAGGGARLSLPYIRTINEAFSRP